MATADTIKEVLDGRREFTYEMLGQDKIIAYIAQPSGEDLRKADWEYAKVFNKAISDGFLTQSQMLEYLKEKGIVDDDYAQEVESVRTQLATQLYRLDNAADLGSELDKEALALDIARLRDELFRLNQRVNGPMGNTCENLAEDARIEFLTSRVVQKKDRTPFWKNYDEYQKYDNVTFTIKARFEVMLWIQGLESNFLENTPEQVALRQIAQERLNRVTEEQKVLEAAEQEKAVKAEEAPVAEEAVALPPKKAGRPRKKTPKTE